MPTRCKRWFLLQILLLAQHVSGTIMPIIKSSRVLYRWLLPVVFGALVFKLSVRCWAEGYVSGLRTAATAAARKPDICLHYLHYLLCYQNKRISCYVTRTNAFPAMLPEQTHFLLCYQNKFNTDSVKHEKLCWLQFRSTYMSPKSTPGPRCQPFTSSSHPHTLFTQDHF